jgi:hypothetical protein
MASEDLDSFVVILKRLLLALKDLCVPREHSRVFCANAKSRVWHASFNAAATGTSATGEVKTFKMALVCGSFGPFLGMSVLKSTGSSVRFNCAPDHHRLDHFIPLLTTS